METALETIQRTSAISFPGLLGDFSMNPPASFVLFGRNIYFYGVIIALGFLLGITYCTKNAKRFGIKVIFRDNTHSIFGIQDIVDFCKSLNISVQLVVGHIIYITVY